MLIPARYIKTEQSVLYVADVVDPMDAVDAGTWMWQSSRCGDVMGVADVADMMAMDALDAGTWWMW